MRLEFVVEELDLHERLVARFGERVALDHQRFHLLAMCLAQLGLSRQTANQRAAAALRDRPGAGAPQHEPDQAGRRVPRIRGDLLARAGGIHPEPLHDDGARGGSGRRVPERRLRP